jgi:hypothetical protein
MAAKDKATIGKLAIVTTAQAVSEVGFSLGAGFILRLTLLPFIKDCH